MSGIASSLLEYNVNVVATPNGVRLINLNTGKFVSRHEVVMAALKKAGYVITSQVAQLLQLLNK